MSTSQTALWTGAFGDAYTERNAIQPEQMRARVSMWSRILRCTVGDPPQSILEIGANVGANLRALRALTAAEFKAVEPNAKAREVLVNDGVVAPEHAIDAVATKLPLSDGAADLAFTSGVLIHIHPDDLPASRAEIYRCARRWIVCIEYFADKPVEISYRGHDNALFKRDFGSDWLDQFPDLQTVDYGFEWKRATALDNLTWWIFRKP